MSENSNEGIQGPAPLRSARELLAQARTKWPDTAALDGAQRITSSYPKPRPDLPDTSYMTLTMLAYIEQADEAIWRAIEATAGAEADKAISEADRALVAAIKAYPEADRMVR